MFIPVASVACPAGTPPPALTSGVIMGAGSWVMEGTCVKIHICTKCNKTSRFLFISRQIFLGRVPYNQRISFQIYDENTKITSYFNSIFNIF